MPAKSEKQRRFMAAVANNPKFANKAGVPQSVGEEFMKKSKGYMGGGMMKRYAGGGKLDMVEKDGKMVPFYAADGKGRMMGGGKVMKYFEGGSTRGPNPSELDGAEAKDQAEYMDKIMDKMPPQSKALATRGAKPKSKPKAPTKKMGEGKIEGYKKGGKVRGCGMAKQGVRPAKMIKMKGA